MTINYRIDQATDTIHVRAPALLTTSAILDFMDRLMGDPDVREGMNELIDLRSVTDYRVDAKGIRTIADGHAKHEESIRFDRCAFVADQDAVYGMVRMYEAVTEGLSAEIRGFRTMEDARAWLGLDGAS